jgi:hypothetical protein
MRQYYSNSAVTLISINVKLKDRLVYGGNIDESFFRQVLGVIINSQ